MGSGFSHDTTRRTLRAFCARLSNRWWAIQLERPQPVEFGEDDPLKAKGCSLFQGGFEQPCRLRQIDLPRQLFLRVWRIFFKLPIATDKKMW